MEYTTVCTVTTPQDIVIGTPAAITWDTEPYDRKGIHSTTVNPSRFTAPTRGFYWFGGVLKITSDDSANIMELDARVNGVLAQIMQISDVLLTTGVYHKTFLGVVFLQAGDYLDFLVTPTLGAGGKKVTVGANSNIVVGRVDAGDPYPS